MDAFAVCCSCVYLYVYSFDYVCRRELCILGFFHLILAGRSALSLIFDEYPTGEVGGGSGGNWN